MPPFLPPPACGGAWGVTSVAAARFSTMRGGADADPRGAEMPLRAVALFALATTFGRPVFWEPRDDWRARGAVCGGLVDFAMTMPRDRVFRARQSMLGMAPQPRLLSTGR